ncbi:MAG TPA: T9SS type A sorting domain-containing protein, partial [Bacteroidia bacterium]|nr:T9SS type A sorting domain-containing protein [Bacteroidia bacterium]
GFVYHNPGAYDPEGDSMSFSLVPCYTSVYDFPNATINPITGDLVVPVSDQDSIYLIAIRIDEWRRDSSGQSFHMGYVIRDMVIDIPLIINIEENSGIALCSIFPNPTSDVITFQFAGSQQLRIVSLCDHLGRDVWREETNENSITISVHEFAEGIYFYSVINDAGQATAGKFIVAH